MSKSQYDVHMEDPEFRRMMASESLVEDAAELVARRMKEENVSKADLARKLGKSRAWVTQILAGSANMTIRTLAELMFALDSEVSLSAKNPQWGEASKMPPAPAATIRYRLLDWSQQGPITDPDLPDEIPPSETIAA